MPENKLPGYNCGECGYRTCKEYSKSKKKKKCPFVKDVFDNIRKEGADFRLGALKGEPSCREWLLPVQYTDPAILTLGVGDVIKYRPVGCPIVHFAKIIGYHSGLLEVHIIGPQKKYVSIGMCMVIAFEGEVVEGKIPNPCETVIFMPDRCMMQKCHSGVITSVEGKKVKIEGIHLAVWRKL